MVATSGDRLIAPETVQVLVRELFPRATVVTPNLDEAALLLGARHRRLSRRSMQAASDLLALGARAVLLKGGHLPGEQVVDVLAQAGGARQRLRSARIASRNLHGTGCTLSSAIAAHLALGHALAAGGGAGARLHSGGDRGRGRTCKRAQGTARSTTAMRPVPTAICRAVTAPQACLGRVSQASAKVSARVGSAEPHCGAHAAAARGRWRCRPATAPRRVTLILRREPAPTSRRLPKPSRPRITPYSGTNTELSSQQERLQAVHRQHQGQRSAQHARAAGPSGECSSAACRLCADTEPE